MNTARFPISPAARFLALAISATLLAGCMTGPDFVPPPVQAPSGWTMDPAAIGAATQPSATQPAAQPDNALQITRWWEALDDPILTNLVNQAIESSLDLKLAEQRVLAARAQRKALDSGLYPTVDAGGSYTHSHRSLSTNQNFPGNPVDQNNWQANFDASWELDVWGRVRRGIESADAQLQVEEEYRSDVVVTLLGDVARNYVELRGAQARARVARENVALLRDFQGLAQAKYDAGLVSELDAKQAQAQAAQAQAGIPLFDDDARQASLRIATLLGKQPESTQHLLENPPVLPNPKRIISLGIPADVLRRRPDVRASVQSLAAATATLGVSAAELYPRITLTGAFGFQGIKFTDLFNMSSRYYSITPDVRVRLFDRERIRQEILVSDAQVKQAAITYEKTIVVAIQEVESAIGAIKAQTDRETQLTEAVDSAEAAVQISRIQYERGIADYLTVINAQQSLNVARDARVATQQARLTQVVALYKAMGGGWEGVPMQATPVDTNSDYFREITRVK
jgi:outer membrane protein, multidrug efflux system